ncbi:MAG: hypothetical protein LBR29_12180 [Methylobacteriaceae bacterium]|jgi:hypothetical protein|nr:hypothetical protein [Methylobacteriaceae bacterium]
MGFTKHFCIAALGAALVALSGPAAVAQEDEPLNSGLMELDVLQWTGLIPPKRPIIEYRERAPLVVPPAVNGQALPEPVARGAIRDKVTNWPKDPDVEAYEKAKREAMLPETLTEDYEQRKGNPISPDKLRITRSQMHNPYPMDLTDPKRNQTLPDGSRYKEWVHPDELRAAKNSSELSQEEPARQALSDPPSGYRKPTGALKKPVRGSANQSDMDEGNPYYFLREQQGR